jgi:hypothetical protein
MKRDIFQKQTRWQRSGSGATPSNGPRLAFSPVFGGVVMVAVLAGLIIGRTQPTPRQTVLPSPEPAQAVLSLTTPTLTATPAPTATSVAVTATPSCTSAAAYLDAIVLAEKLSQWEQAASTAALAYQLADLCAADKQALAEKVVAAGVEALFSQKLPSYADVAAQQQQVETFHQLKHRAAATHVAFPTDIQVAFRAYQGGQFLLAKIAFEEAFTAGTFTTADHALVQAYCSTVFNLGWHWTAEGSGQTQQDGLALLVTANAIDETYQVGSRAAWGELHRRLGDERTWPATAPSPLLQQP